MKSAFSCDLQIYYKFREYFSCSFSRRHEYVVFLNKAFYKWKSPEMLDAIWINYGFSLYPTSVKGVKIARETSASFGVGFTSDWIK